MSGMLRERPMSLLKNIAAILVASAACGAMGSSTLTYAKDVQVGVQQANEETSQEEIATQGDVFDVAASPKQIQSLLKRKYADYYLIDELESNPNNRVNVLERQIIEKQIAFEILRKRANAADQTNSEIANQLSKKANQCFYEAISQYEELIQNESQNPRAPIWKTNVAEMYLLQNLQLLHYFAAESVTLGMPTPEQERAFLQSVNKAFVFLADAKRDLDEMQTSLPRKKGYEDWATRGLTTQLFEEYSKKRVPYFLSLAALYVAQMPNSAEYFTQQYDVTNSLTVRVETIDQERVRLVNLAMELIDSFVADKSDAAGVRFASMVNASQVMLLLDDPAAAAKLLMPVLDSPRRDLTNLVAHMVYAKALSQVGKYDRAEKYLKEVSTSHRLCKNSVLFRLLVVDGRFKNQLMKISQMPAGKQADGRYQAYRVYTSLLEDKSITAEKMLYLKHLLAMRFESILYLTSDYQALPHELLALISDYAVQQVQQLGGWGKADDSLLRKYSKLTEHIASCTNVEGEDREIRARALYNKIVVNYLANKQTLKTKRESANQLIDLARLYPTQSISARAMFFGVQTLQKMCQHDLHNHEIRKDYSSAVQALFEFFPLSKVADNQRMFYAYYVLQKNKDYTNAVAQYEQVRFEQDQYYQAQRELLYCLNAMLADPQTSNQEYAIWFEELERKANKLEYDVSKEKREGATGQRIKDGEYAVASSKMIRAIAAQRTGDAETALSTLAKLDVDFNAYPDLLQQYLQVQVEALVAKADLAKATEIAGKFIKQYPEQAAGTIDRLLRSLNDSFVSVLDNSLLADQPNAVNQQEQNQALLAVTLIDSLLANGDPQLFDRQYKLQMSLIKVRVYLLMNQLDAASDVLKSFETEFSHMIDWVWLTAETNYRLGNVDSIKQAMPLYTRLINSLSNNKNAKQYWQAWLRYLMCCDSTGERVKQIPLRVRQLQMQNPDLGGEAFKNVFMKLHDKYAKKTKLSTS